jgi:hypothetical protein
LITTVRERERERKKNSRAHLESNVRLISSFRHPLLKSFPLFFCSQKRTTKEARDVATSFSAARSGTTATKHHRTSVGVVRHSLSVVHGHVRNRMRDMRHRARVFSH